MSLLLLAGPSNVPLSLGIAGILGIQPADCEFGRFPDGELHVLIGESVRGADVYVVQSTSPPVDAHLMQLLLLADACRRAGAARLTGVVPYFGYSRQDRRASGREPIGARLVADLLATGGLARVVAVDLHTSALEGTFSVPLEHVTAVPLLAEAVRAALPEKAVLVSPDLGATKLAERYARILDLPVAFVHKQRVSGTSITVRGITGEVRGRAPVIVDDMISTGGTIEGAVRALVAAGAVPEFLVVATHGLLVGDALQRLAALPIRSMLVSDSIESKPSPLLSLRTVGIAPLLADVIRRLHQDRSLSDLLVHT
ncbi:MAG TPA: ribose-phosphate pyrophosphokinase [Gemmatimonadales bacterium]|nr:ribose-phosphate pyrophosphokinase [Gemmatimonadales bacterium]